METARILAAPHGKPVTPKDGLREISHGHWEGKTRAEVEKEYPKEYARWAATRISFSPPGGETGLAVDGARPADPSRDRAGASGRIGPVASHKATIRLLIGSLLGFDLRRYRDHLDQSPASLNILDFQDVVARAADRSSTTSRTTPRPRRGRPRCRTALAWSPAWSGKP